MLNDVESLLNKSSTNDAQTRDTILVLNFRQKGMKKGVDETLQCIDPSTSLTYTYRQIQADFFQFCIFRWKV